MGVPIPVFYETFEFRADLKEDKSSFEILVGMTQLFKYEWARSCRICVGQNYNDPLYGSLHQCGQVMRPL